MSPRRLGRWTLGEHLGAGGMGDVFRARSTNPAGALVEAALKLTRGGYAGALQREIETIAAIDHPGVVAIVDQGVHEGRPWYAMELVLGSPLSRVLVASTLAPGRPGRRTTDASVAGGDSTVVPGRGAHSTRSDVADSWWTLSAANLLSMPGCPEGGVSVDAAGRAEGKRAGGVATVATETLVSLLDALSDLHARGIVHGDLKPSNVMVRYADDRAVLVDFGLASWGGNATRERLETAASDGGTARYVAPERWRGGAPSPQSDLYSLGCILYQVLTGVPVFTGDVEALRRAHLTRRPNRPSEVVDCAEALDAVVMACLAKSPTDRPGSAAQVRARWLAGAGDTDPADLVAVGLRRPPLVGRDDASDALAAALDGAARAVMVVGAEGLGKTRMLSALARRPDDTTCVGLSLTALGPAATASDLGGGLRTALAHRIGVDVAADVSASAQWDRNPGDAFVADLDRVVERVGRVWLVVDDVQAGSPSVLDALAYASRARDAREWTLCLLTRPSPKTASLRDDCDEVVILEPLAPVDVEALLDATFDGHIPAAWRDALVELAGGNPGFVREAALLAVGRGDIAWSPQRRWHARHAPDTSRLPETLADALVARIDGLGPAARRAADGLAVLGDPAAPEALAILLDDAPALDALLEAGVLAAAPLRFRHLGTAAALLARMDVAERERGHRRALDRLELTPERRARHLEGIGANRRAADLWRAEARAASASAGASHVARAAAAWRRVVSLDPALPGGQRGEAARACLAAGRADDALAILDVPRGDARDAAAYDDDARLLRARAMEVGGDLSGAATALGDAEGIDAGLLRTRLAILAGDFSAAWTHGIDVLARLRGCAPDQVRLELASPPRREALEALRHLGTLCWRRGELDRARAILRPLIDAALEAGFEAEACRAMLALVPAVNMAFDSHEMGVWDRRALAIAQRLGDQAAEAQALDYMGSTHLSRSDFEAAVPCYERAAALARRLGLDVRLKRALGNLALTLTELGRLGAAESAQREAIERAERVGVRDSLPDNLANLGRLVLRRGRPEEGRAILERALSVASEIGDRNAECIVLTDLAHAAVERGDATAAMSWAERAVEVADDTGIEPRRRWARLSLARSHCAAADLDASDRVLETCLRSAVAAGDVTARIVALVMRVHNARLRGGDDVEAADLARSLVAASGAPRFALDLVADLSTKPERS